MIFEEEDLLMWPQTARDDPDTTMREENTMSTKDQLLAMRAELESHVENLRRLRKEATADDADDKTLDEYGEAIKFQGWVIRNLQVIIDRDPGDEDDAWPEPDGMRIEDGFGRIIPTSR